MIKLSHSGFFQSSGRRFTAIPGTSLSHSKAKYIIGEMGETGPELEPNEMPAERKHEPYEPQEFAPAKPETGPHLSRWKKLALLAETAVLLPTLAACARGDKGGDVQVTPTGTAPIIRTAEITPTVTTPAGETIVPGTNVAVGKGVETATVTPTATSTEAVKPTSTPEPTKTPEKPVSVWIVSVDQGVEGTSKSGRTVEQDKGLIQEALKSIPKIGDEKIVLVSGSQSKFNIETQTVYIGREVSSEILKYKVLHEMTHSLDIEVNGEALLKVLTPVQVEDLKKIRQRALGDAVWGVDYQSLDKIFNPVKANVTMDKSKAYSQVELAQLSNKYADAVWIGGRGTVDEQEIRPFSPLMVNTLSEIRQHVKSNDAPVGFMTIGQFLENPTAKAELDRMSKENQLFAIALDLIREKKDLFAVGNVVWPNSYGAMPVMLSNGRTSAWEILPTYVDLVLKDGYLNGDARIKNFLAGKPEAVAGVNSSIESLKAEANREGFAEKAAIGLSFGVKTSASPYLDKLFSFTLN